VVIGGLVTSTFLSLLVIPVLYTFVDDFVQGVIRLQHRLQHRLQNRLRAATRRTPSEPTA